MSAHPKFPTLFKLLPVLPVILMASACGRGLSTSEIPPTGFPPASAPSGGITLPAEPGPTLETNPAHYQAQTACDSPYLPLRKGTTWTYRTQGPQGSPFRSEVITVTDLQGDLSQAAATVTSQIPDAKGQLQTSTASYICDSQGIQLQGSMLPSYTLLQQLPAVAYLMAGTSWDVANQKTIKASAPCWGGGTYTRLSHYEVRGTEPIKLVAGAGGWQSALRIDEVNPLSPLATPSAASCTQSTANSWWLIPGRGVVHHEIVVSRLDESFAYTIVTDLVSETLP